jgi:uncharacterized protein
MSERELIKFESEGLLLEGRLGLLEKLYSLAVIICHPHPQFGGSMNNNVVYALEHQFGKRGFSTLSFNFRGVGESEGEYSEMRGETEDVISALSYLAKKEKTDSNKICLAGYSFGGLMVLYAMSKIISFSGLSKSKDPASDTPLPGVLALVSPMDPGNGFKEDDWNKPLFTCPPDTFITTGTRDPFCSVNSAKELCVNIGPKARLAIVEGADHFYGQMEYEAAVSAAEFAASVIDR